jgi:RNA polymerase sigma-70 factor, ECF subfamily
VKVFLRAAEFDASRDALSWALGIGAYEIRTTRKRRERRREADADVSAREDPSATPEEAAIAADLDAAIDAALRDLGPADAETLRAFAEGERPAGVAPATFRKRVERGLRRLRARWRATHDNGR